jgi:hypothetical protein
MDPILAVANKGTLLVTTTTQYLSTLPQQIDAVEELISITAVTSSLLTSLSSSLTRFSFSNPPFLTPLLANISRAFSELDLKIQDAKLMKVFEKNECGLVRAPRFAWYAVCGCPQEAGRLRGRLGVEKYRVRVLVDAVTWEGLRRMEGLDEGGRKELEGLREMVPLLVERLRGMVPLLVERLKGESVSEKVVVVQAKPVEVAKEKIEDLDLDHKKSSILSIHSLSSTSTLTSTTTSSS